VKPQVSIFTNNGSLVWAGPEYVRLNPAMTDIFEVVSFPSA
jgi:hypothetical protein